MLLSEKDFNDNMKDIYQLEGKKEEVKNLWEKQWGDYQVKSNHKLLLNRYESKERIQKKQYFLVLLFSCSPYWTWTSDPLINSQML